MSILKRDEYFNALHARLGEDTSEESIAFLEDMTDTYNDLENRANGDGEDWKQKYYDLDESWKKRYRHRFFTGGGGKMPEDEPEEKAAEEITIDELFKED